METPRPLEETDPWLAEQFRQIANKEHETIESLYVTGDKMYIRPKRILKVTKVGRNDPCPCLSGRKYKHCCGKG